MCRIFKKDYNANLLVPFSVVEPEPPFLGWSQSRFLFVRSREPEPSASFWQAKKESLVLKFTKHDLTAVFNGKCDPKKNCINNSLFKNQNDKF